MEWLQSWLFGAKLSNWRSQANVCILSGWEIVFPWNQTSVKWHDIWKWLHQDWLISALKTSDSPTILNPKTSTSFVNIKQNNGMHTNVWAGFQTAWEKSTLCLLPQKSTFSPWWTSACYGWRWILTPRLQYVLIQPRVDGETQQHMRSKLGKVHFLQRVLDL